MKRSKFAMLVYWLVAGAAILLLTLWAARVSHGALADCIDATCRITAEGGSRGSGCVFEISQDRVFVLTAAHVVGRSTAVQCEFWRDGHQSEPLRAEVIARNAAADAAIISLPAVALGGVLPPAIPLAPRDSGLPPGAAVTSVGCAHGAWSTGWKGHVLGYQGDDLHFVPPPANGRSGSAVFDAEGRAIVGLLRARTTDDAYGIATSVEAIYAAFQTKAESGKPRAESGKRKAESGTANPQSQIINPKSEITQCPGGNCPAPPSDWNLSPYRQRQKQHDDSQNGRIDRLERVWPTLPQQPPQPLPAPQSAPAAPPVDLSPTNQKLDKIAELLGELRGEPKSKPAPAVPAEPARPAPDEAAKKAAEAALSEVETTKKETNRLRETIEKLIGDRETLQQRFEARLEKVKTELGEGAGTRDVARAYMKDLVQEKLADGTLGLSGGKLVGGALGLSAPLAFALGLGLWLVSKRIGAKVEAGEPLLVQRAFDRLGDKLDALRERIHSAPSQPPKE